MQLPPLQPFVNLEPFVSGDVKIDPSAAIAPGVILQAASNCQIIIGAGVCIGMGAIIHAYNGNIEIESGATIGSGVLLVGKSKIGAGVCIGSLATIIEQNLESEKVVLPGSIIGNSWGHSSENSTISLPNQESDKSDLSSNKTQENNYNLNSKNTSSSVEETQTETAKANAKLPSANTSLSAEEIQIETAKANTKLQSANTSSSAEETQTDEEAKTQLQEELLPNIDTRIYGKEYVNQIMQTLFPYKNSLSSHPDDED